MAGCVSADLVKMARCVVEKIDRDVGTGASRLHAALLASQLYEALKIELETTPRHEPAKVGLLAAAIDQCRRAVRFPISLEFMAVELAAVLTILEATPARSFANRRPNQARSRLTLIQGGLSPAV